MTPFLQENVVFREVYCFLGGNEGNAGWCRGDGLLPGGFTSEKTKPAQAEMKRR